MFALVSGVGTAEAIKRYLPDHWKLASAAEANSRVLALIEGDEKPGDPGGWSFANYVVPRLASGNYTATEVSETAGYLAVLATTRMTQQ